MHIAVPLPPKKNNNNKTEDIPVKFKHIVVEYMLDNFQHHMRRSCLDIEMVAASQRLSEGCSHPVMRYV